MPARIHIAEEGELAVVTFAGPTDLADLQEATRRLSEGGRYRFPRRLYDLRTAAIDLGHEDVRRIAEETRALGRGPSRVAILVADDLAYGIARMFEVFREDASTRTHVFRDEAEARAWVLEG